MRKGKILSIIFNMTLQKSWHIKGEKTKTESVNKCKGFLCLGDDSCKSMNLQNLLCAPIYYYDLAVSLTNVLLSVGNDTDFNEILVSTIDQFNGWAECFDRRQVLIANMKIIVITIFRLRFGI